MPANRRRKAEANDHLSKGFWFGLTTVRTRILYSSLLRQNFELFKAESKYKTECLTTPPKNEDAEPFR